MSWASVVPNLSLSGIDNVVEEQLEAIKDKSNDIHTKWTQSPSKLRGSQS